MKQKLLLFLIVILLTTMSWSQSIDKEIQQAYSRLSVMFHQRSLGGVMGYIDDNFQSDMRWNKGVLKLVVNQLLASYPSFEMVSKVETISYSSTSNIVTVHWHGEWIASPDRNGNTRTRFPCFGSQYIHPDTDWYQIHQWKKVGKLLKLTRVYTDVSQFHATEKKNILPLVQAFHQETGDLGIAFGRNILNSVDTNGILFVSGESPSFALIYLKEFLHERPDVTIFDYGFWFGEVAGLENIQQLPIQARPRAREDAEIHLLQTSIRPVYSLSERQYYSMNSSMGTYSITYYSIPHGMVYQILSSKTTVQISLDTISTLNHLDTFLKSSSNYTQRELVSNYHFSLGMNYQYHGDSTRAMKEFTTASQIGYDIQGLSFNVGNILTGIYNNTTTSIPIYSQEIDYNPWLSMVYFPLGKLQKEYGLNRQAIFNIESGLIFEPFNPEAHLMLAQLYTSDQNWEFAKREYLKFIDLAPYNQAAYLELGKIFEKQELWNQALVNYQAYLNFPMNSKDTVHSEIENKVIKLKERLKKK